jgi:hypothetical protein
LHLQGVTDVHPPQARRRHRPRLAGLGQPRPRRRDHARQRRHRPELHAHFNGFADGQTIQDLTAATTLTLTGITGTSYNFNYSVTNTTSDPVNSRISSFGFNTSPNATSATSTGTFGNALVGGQAPEPVQERRRLLQVGGSNSCSGSGGLTDGQTGTGTLTLSFASARPS